MPPQHGQCPGFCCTLHPRRRARGAVPVAPGWVGAGFSAAVAGGPGAEGSRLGCCPRPYGGSALGFPQLRRVKPCRARTFCRPGAGEGRNAVPGAASPFSGWASAVRRKGNPAAGKGKRPCFANLRNRRCGPGKGTRGRVLRPSDPPPIPGLSRRAPRPGSGRIGTARPGRRPSHSHGDPAPPRAPPARTKHGRRAALTAAVRLRWRGGTEPRRRTAPSSSTPPSRRGRRPIGAGSSPADGAVPGSRRGCWPISERRGRGGGRSVAVAGRPRRRHRPWLPLPPPARPGPARGSAPTPACPAGPRPGAGRGRRAG